MSLQSFWGFLGGPTGPVLPPAPYDWSGYASMCKSYVDGSGPLQFFDVSGHGKHLTTSANDGTFQYVYDSISEQMAYYADQTNQQAGWLFQQLSAVKSNYDVITAFRVRTASETYLTLLEDDTQDFTYGRTYLELNCEEVKTLYQKTPLGPVLRSVGETVIVKHRLNAQEGVSVEVNGVTIIKNVPGYIAAKVLSGYAFNQSQGQVLQGWHMVWGLHVGNQTEAQWAPARAELMRELKVKF